MHNPEEFLSESTFHSLFSVASSLSHLIAESSLCAMRGHLMKATADRLLRTSGILARGHFRVHLPKLIIASCKTQVGVEYTQL